MANIVAGFGVPHTPVFPFFVKRDGPDCEIAKLFAAQKENLAAARPDVIVMLDPIISIRFSSTICRFSPLAWTRRSTGPNDEPREMPVYKIPSAVDLAAHIRQLKHRSRLRRRADPALLRRSFDHGAAAFPHAGNACAGRSLLHQRPRPRRCRPHNAAMRWVRRSSRAIASWPAPLRVVVMGSGSFSLEVAGPRMAPHRTDGVPDPDWALRIIKLMEEQQIDKLISRGHAASVPQGRQCRRRIAQLDRDARRHRQPQARLTSPPQMQNGHAYGVWRWN